MSLRSSSARPPEAPRPRPQLLSPSRGHSYTITPTPSRRAAHASPPRLRIRCALPVRYLHALDQTAGGSTQPPPSVLRVLASKACRRAVMFGTSLGLDDRRVRAAARCARCVRNTRSALPHAPHVPSLRSQRILRELSRCELPFQCAHGRPTLAPLVRLGALPTFEN